MTLIEPTDRADQAPPARGLTAFVLTGYLVAFAAVTMLNVALPAAQADLGMSTAGRQWVVTAYSLTFGGFMLLGGRLGDLLGLRRALTLGLAGYAATSVVAGLAPSAAVLVLGRAGQGIAAALVAPAGLALLSVSFPSGPARARAFGILGTVMGVGTAGSLVLAGWLVDVASWRWAILLGAAAAAVSAVGVARTAPPDAPVRTTLDVRGAVLVTGGSIALVLGFDRARSDGWTSTGSLALLALGAALAAVFVWWVATRPLALVPRRVLTDGGRAPAYVAVFVLAIGLFAGMFLLTGHLQDVRGWSALRTGLGFLPFSVSAMAASRVIGRWGPSTSPRLALVVGLLATGGALALVARLDPGTPYATGVLPAMALLGLAGTVVMVTASEVATRAAGPDSGIAGAAVGAVQQLGAALGTALLTSIASGSTTGLDPTDGAWRQAVVDGSSRAAAVGTVLVVVGAVLVAATGRRTGSR